MRYASSERRGRRYSHIRPACAAAGAALVLHTRKRVSNNVGKSVIFGEKKACHNYASPAKTTPQQQPDRRGVAAAVSYHARRSRRPRSLSSTSPRRYAQRLYPRVAQRECPTPQTPSTTQRAAIAVTNKSALFNASHAYSNDGPQQATDTLRDNERTVARRNGASIRVQRTPTSHRHNAIRRQRSRHKRHHAVRHAIYRRLRLYVKGHILHATSARRCRNTTEPITHVAARRGVHNVKQRRRQTPPTVAAHTVTINVNGAVLRCRSSPHRVRCLPTPPQRHQQNAVMVRPRHRQRERHRSIIRMAHACVVTTGTRHGAVTPSYRRQPRLQPRQRYQHNDGMSTTSSIAVHVAMSRSYTRTLVI
ncbi:hypothetical protein NPIL_692701 [Nephila pilipes]|uniref:Uncharacterized protein n=1 Tax=Nephila pilipes TaxID=299642 RepID=A0A8X6Q6F2_NEPPI|nr:hypothetical protein NPIL_692701 [Nephila pilipes]